MKSPIKDTRFPNKFIGELKRAIPKGSQINACGLFSAAPELSFSLADRRVSAFTDKPVIYQFWHCLFENKQRLYNILTDSSFRFNGTLDYNLLQKTLPSYEDAYIRSSLFFMLNRCSNTGQISCGEFSPRSYTEKALHNLRAFRRPELFNIFLYKEKHQDMLECDYLLFHSLSFSYNLTHLGTVESYDNYSFHNKKLKAFLTSANNKVILVYNRHPALFRFYEGQNLTMIDKYGKATDDREQHEELIVTNF